MQPINTSLTKLLNIKTPILAAPMAFASTAELTAAVSGAGGFGLFGAGFDTPAQLKETIQTVRTQLGVPKGSPVPMGIGFIGWILDMTEPSDDPRLEAILDELPVAIWFAFGVDLGKYVAQVRAYDAKRDHKTVIFVIVSSAADALRAATEWGVDVVVAQGNEAGGHGSSISPPLFDLIPSVLETLPRGFPVVAAGGIATGSQVGALLALGVAGVVLGTRFLFTNECRYTDQIKSVLVDADLRSTQRSLCFDEVNRTNFWPPFHDGRAIANSIWDDFASGLTLDERMKKHDESNARGDKDRLVIWAGIGAGLTNKITPAADVVKDIHEEAIKSIQTVSSLLS